MKRFSPALIILFALVSDFLIASDSGVITSETTHQLPDTLMVIPFVLLLLMIATGPLFYKHFWEHHYPKVAISLGAITVIYYLGFLNDSHSILHTLAEYLSFIALLSSLFVASGGILIKVDKKSTPLLNVLFLAFGAIISNIIGTTGASMLLIRPFHKDESEQNKTVSHYIFYFYCKQYWRSFNSNR